MIDVDEPDGIGTDRADFAFATFGNTGTCSYPILWTIARRPVSAIPHPLYKNEEPSVDRVSRGRLRPSYSISLGSMQSTLETHDRFRRIGRLPEFARCRSWGVVARIGLYLSAESRFRLAIRNIGRTGVSSRTTISGVSPQ